jgi:hypothetical protein
MELRQFKGMELAARTRINYDDPDILPMPAR